MGCKCKKNKTTSKKSGVIKLNETDLTSIIRKVVKEKQKRTR